jgi:hypothetical protein
VRRSRLIAFALLLLAAPALRAQQPAAPPTPANPPLEVGAVAPDFSLPGGTRYGVLREPVRLSDFRGKAVILAFYFRSRTRG